MRQLLPEPLDVVDPARLHAGLDRPAHADRPWVAMNMVASIDGATQIEGLSGGLGGAADKALFSALRAVADVILVAAGTVRAERYGPPRLAPPRRAERRARGQAEVPRLAIVSGSLDLDLQAALFTEAAEQPFVITSPAADGARAEQVSKVGRLLVVGEGGRVDLAGALVALRDQDVRLVLVEGGPSLNGQLFAAGLVDELNLSVSPLLTGVASKGLTAGTPPAVPIVMRLSHALTDDGFLFLRYLSD